MNFILIILHSISIIYGLIMDPYKDQLPVGLITRLVEHCSGIAEVRVRVPFRPEFFRPFLLKSSAKNCEDHTYSYVKFIGTKYVINSIDVIFSSPLGFHIRILHGDGIEARRIWSSRLCQDSLEYIWWIHCSNKYCRSNTRTRKDWRRRKSQCAKDISIGKL